ncbi:hypothetical protein ABW21_db0207750 [Orbilia brochopaga]|nr:hypothetical protein ABW21_db0207750 [Drechslerella brochopaga]
MVTLRLGVWGLAAISLFSGADARPHHVHGDSLAARDVSVHRHVARDPKGGKKQQAISSGGGSADWGMGLVYSPYADGGDCKKEDVIVKEINMAFTKGDKWKWLRIYGVDCNQIPVVVSTAAKNNAKVFLGIYDLSDSGKVAESTKAIIEGVKAANKKSGKPDNDWSSIIGVSVGNEWLFNHPGDGAAKLKGLADETRKTLRAAGFKGPVTNTDVWTIHLKEKALCGEDEVVTVNMHPFFDQKVTANDAGKFLATHAKEIETFCGKPCVIAETGWPNAGNKLNNAVPGQKEQKTFLQEAKKNMKNYCVLSAFNEGWKQSGPSNVEKNWGIYTS